MGIELPIALSDLRTLVTGITGHTREAPVAEINQAINYGYGKVIRAIAAVRPQIFLSWIDPFTLSNGVTEYDLGAYDPPLWRPIRLLVGAGGGQRVIRFKYKSLADREFEERELAPSASYEMVFYDVLEGRLPGTTFTLAAIGASTTQASVIPTTAAASLYVGQPIEVAGVGPQISYPGGATVPSNLRTNIVFITGSNITVDPQATLQLTGVATPIRRRLLKIAPATSDTVTGRLYYHYRPAKLSQSTDQLDVIASEHRDVIVFYAVHQLLQAVDEVEARNWLAQAEAMRSELIQDIEPLAGQGSEALGSDLIGLGDT